MSNVSLIIPAAGIGKRFSNSVKKQFYEFDNQPIIYWTIKRMVDSYKFSELIIGLDMEDIDYLKDIIGRLNLNIHVEYVCGGIERMNTVLNCVEKSTCEFVAVHDSIRPFVSNATILEVIEKALETNAAICGVPVRDTIKKCNNETILSTISRHNIFLAHTPQVFNKQVLVKALLNAVNENLIVTDEASACEYINVPVSMVASNFENIKVTYADDTDLINLFKKKFFEVIS